MNPLLKPCEERLQMVTKRRSLRITIPRENSDEETRMPLTPQAVEVLVAQGHTVVIETLSGSEARFSDQQYSDAGAQIVGSHAQAFDGDIILKLSLPAEDELQYIKDKQTIIAFATRHGRPAEVYKALAKKECNIIALDFLSDSDEEEPVVTRCLGELEGMLAITTAACLLERTNGGKGIIIGGVTGVPPTEIIILGAGRSALCAARTALALGALVRVFDNHHSNLQKMAQQLPHHVFTSILHPQALSKAMVSADVIIGMHAIPGEYQYCVEEDVIRLMKRGAIAIDLNTTSGVRFETSTPTTLQSPTYVRDNVIHHCLPDISMLAPHTATIVISDIITPIIGELAEFGNLTETIKNYGGVARGTVMFRGLTTNQCIAERFGTEFYNIALLII